MPHVVRSALMPYAAERMFALVDDVERYPEFLPWCESVQVLTRDEDVVVAALTLARAGFRHRLVTRNSRAVPERIGLELVDGPFRRFAGGWTFTRLSADGCKVELELDFDFVRGLPKPMFAPFFTKAAGTLVDAFCKRARARG